MSTKFDQPRVEQMVFHLYTRPLHPELFETVAFRRVQREDYTLSVRITLSGHVITWQSPHGLLTEVTATGDQPLPARGHLMKHRFQGEHCDGIRVTPNVSYQMSSQVELLPPEVFLHVHEELLEDGKKRGLLHHYAPHHRLSLSPLGYVTIEAWQGCLSIATFHTYPDEFAVVKTQSLIERSQE